MKFCGGRIDGLVLLEKLWIVLIEAKKTTLDVEVALPQTLAYMAAAPDRSLPLYGMVTNGSSYLFVKTLVLNMVFLMHLRRDRNIATRCLKY